MLRLWTRFQRAGLFLFSRKWCIHWPQHAQSRNCRGTARARARSRRAAGRASTTQEIDMLIERYLAQGVFHRLKPAAREVLSNIIARRIAEVEAAEVCGDVGAALAEYDERARLLAMARTMGR